MANAFGYATQGNDIALHINTSGRSNFFDVICIYFTNQPPP
jgi:hypothetical protein